MTKKTLNSYIEILRPVQQDYIVFCVQKYSDKPEFHRGLLPFLEAEEAARCLTFHLEDIKAAKSLNDPDEAGKAMLGEKFIKQIISVFRSAIIYRLSDDEDSEVIHLNTVKLKRKYGTRFANKFYIRLAELGIHRKKAIEGLVELQMVSRNKWKVTAHKDFLVPIASWLNDECG